jgi:hypothetical protein
MRSVSGVVGVLALILSLTGCATMSDVNCAPGMGQPMLVFDLFFGRAITGRNDLTEAEWQDFLADTVTVNLPGGYSVMDAAGAWMSPISHQTVKAATKVLLVALPDRPASLAAVNRVRTAYEGRFHQQLVGITVTPACGSF